MTEQDLQTVLTVQKRFAREARQRGDSAAYGAAIQAMLFARKERERFLRVAKPCQSTWILRCTGHQGCCAHRRLEPGTLVEWWNGRPAVSCDCCGATMNARLLSGHVTEHECGAKCQSAKGHVCECSCGGLNHGVAA